MATNGCFSPIDAGEIDRDRDDMKPSLDILLIDDNPDDRALALRELRREFPDVQVHEIGDGKALTLAMESGDCDLVITDYQLRWTDGLSVLRAIKTHWPDCPIIMFTGTGSEEIAVEAMKAGLDDYVLKASRHYVRLAGAARRALERTAQRRALRESEANYRMLFADVPIGLYKTTPAGRIIDANPAMIQMLGYADREALLKVSAAELYANPAERRRWQLLMERDGVVRHFETQMRQDDGMVIWLEDNSHAVRSAEGLVLYYEGSLEDITARLNLETKLLQAQKMESIGHLAAGVAHDFNNILTIIKGHADLLLARREVPPEVVGPLEKISSAADRAANVTSQLLTFSRRQAMRPRVLDLNEIVKRVVSTPDQSLGRQIALRFELATRLPPMEADKGMIEQVITNLVINGCDAMPKGGTLTIRTSAVEIDADYVQHNPDGRAGQFICLSVSDTGAGMATETMGRIFDPFFTTKDISRGGGLGLPTAYGITKLHQGWIEVTSQVGQGTTFKVFLPATSKPIEPVPEKPSSTTLRGGAETILVVEDEPELRLLAREILEYYGYRVLEASGASDALKMWPRHGQEIDLLLTDVLMPEGVTGWELASKLRKQQPHLKIICTSGYSLDPPSQTMAEERGFQFLQKPFKPQNLAMAVRECLDA